MLFAPLEDSDREQALKAGRADLKWLMADNEVTEEIQATLYAGGFDRLSPSWGQESLGLR